MRWGERLRGRFAPDYAWFLAIPTLMLSWRWGGGYAFIRLWPLVLLLIAGPPLLRARAEPRRAAAVGALLVGGLTRMGGVCHYVDSTDVGWGYTDRGRIRVRLMFLATRGPGWNSTGGFIGPGRIIDCHPLHLALAVAWLAVLMLAAGWRWRADAAGA